MAENLVVHRTQLEMEEAVPATPTAVLAKAGTVEEVVVAEMRAYSGSFPPVALLYHP